MQCVLIEWKVLFVFVFTCFESGASFLPIRSVPRRYRVPPRTCTCTVITTICTSDDSRDTIIAMVGVACCFSFVVVFAVNGDGSGVVLFFR